MTNQLRLLAIKEYLDDSDDESDKESEELSASNALVHIIVGIIAMLLSYIVFYITPYIKLSFFGFISGLLSYLLLVTDIAFFIVGFFTLLQGLLEMGVAIFLALFDRKS